ncbi:MAG: hypothetical protein K2O18_02165 [Oscillospiraceae bacterium]|nr:hypothetical protein [Oscillospiraceae bacterium]
MKMIKSSVGAAVNILASDLFQAVPVTVQGDAPVPAGMPLSFNGLSVPAGTGADGILLYDVDPTVNPNGALLVQGVVNWPKCMEHAGVSAAAATMKTVLPGIVFRENTGVTPDA